jgi:carboxylesterase
MHVPGRGDKSPIFLPNNGPAVLCLHGFTGTPYEMAPLAHSLADAGYSVSAPMLAGHGQTATTLAATRWQDWLASAEAAFDQLRVASGGGKVAIAGISMGGLLALRLARLHPQGISALVVMAAPLRFPKWKVVAARTLNRLPSFVRRGRLASIRKRGGSDITDVEVRDENPALDEMPLSGVVSMIDLAEVVRRDLSFIHLPTLVAHGERDRTVPIQTSFELAGSIASDVVEHLWLPKSAHVISVDVEHTQLCEAVVSFLSRQMKPEAPAASTENTQ